MDTVISGAELNAQFLGIRIWNLKLYLQALQFTMCGTAGTSYSIAFFLDHQPVKLDESTCRSVTLSKGGVMELEAVIDPEQLGQFNTFYCLAVPRNGTSAPFFKTNSILLYKES